jgi:hypothetical protein
MPLNMTRIAFGAQSPAHLRDRLTANDVGGETRLTTRYLPKRASEMTGGSLYWILNNSFIGRSPLIGFMENGEGRHWIRIEPRPISIVSNSMVATKCHPKCSVNSCGWGWCNHNSCL